MKAINGNKTAVLQTKVNAKVNAIGEAEPVWIKRHTITGWLDYSSGEAQYTYDAKLQESMHVFLSDYVKLDSDITADNSRLIVDNDVYDIVLIDNPMELNKQLEIYLKISGG